MRRFANLTTFPAGLPLSAEGIVEFHAARLLLVLRICGKKGTIDGLTKLAKLDFFVRYPRFFARVDHKNRYQAQSTVEAVGSPMVRFHYGPWDHRYYHILGFMEGSGLVSVSKASPRTYRFSLTELGNVKAESLHESEPFAGIASQIESVSSAFSSFSGKRLRDLIYREFRHEIVELERGRVIQP